MYDVDSGEILIDRENVKNFKLRNLRTLMGTVTQESILFSETIAENIRYGSLSKISDDEIKKVAKIAYADEFIEKLPKNYNSQLSVKGSNFSGGQKQRIAIARALLLDPRILIMDDSTSSVDAETEYKIQQALEELQKGRTTFVIAQRISTVRSADKILVLDNGKLAAEGTHEELQRTSELYMEIIETQFGKDN